MSRLQSLVLSGSQCPDQADFSYAHGSSPTIATLRFQGQYDVSIGSVINLQIGSATWSGFVTVSEEEQNELSGAVTTVRATDWRDRLHDELIFAAFNMQEQSGVHWHLFQEDWEEQRKTYVSKELDVQDIGEFQGNPANILNNIAKQKLLSTYDILNYICGLYEIQWSAETFANNIVGTSRPMNLDWNGGTTVISAIEELLSRSNLQFTFYGANQLYVTARGYTTNMFIQGFLNKMSNICDLGAVSGSVGNEINEDGRYVTVIGDRNKHQWGYPCKQNWNPAFDWEVCFGEWMLNLILKTFGLQLYSKLGDLPGVYHDEEIWQESQPNFSGSSGKRKRTEMRIDEYIESICFKTYIADPNVVVAFFEPLQKDLYSGLINSFDKENLEISDGEDSFFLKDINEYNVDTNWNSPNLNFMWPLSDSLVSDSNSQFLVWKTSNNIIDGFDDPFADQLSFTPTTDGVTLSEEQVLNPDTAKMEYRIRIHFNQPQLWKVPDLEFTEGGAVEPDLIIVELAHLKQMYSFNAGNPDGVKVRRQKVPVSNLYKSYWWGEEVKVIAENFAVNLKDGGVAPGLRPVFADDLADRIANQKLFHMAINSAGNLQFMDNAGFLPDGVISSVSVSFDAQNGIEERVSFTSEINDSRVLIQPLRIKLSEKIDLEADISRDRLEALAEKTVKDFNKVKKVLSVIGKGINVFGSYFGAAPIIKAYNGGVGKDGTIKIKIPLSIVNQFGFDVNDIVIVK